MENRNLKIVIVVLIGLFALYAYLNPPFKNNVTEVPEDVKGNTMPKKIVAEMIANYRNTQLKAIEGVVNNDAHSIWFDIKVLKKFIAATEYNAPKNNKGLGIRFYYAAYPSAKLFGTPGYESLGFLNDNETTKQYGGKHTLVMIPTANIDGANTDFNPSSSPKMIQARMLEVDVMAQNHGGLIPPASSASENY